MDAYPDGYLIDHVSLQCDDVEASGRFYDSVLATLGAARVMEFGDEAVGYGRQGLPTFWIGRHHTGAGFRESHLAFGAPDRATVRSAVAAATATGAEVLHLPRLWPEYHPAYYAGFVRDPDGNNVEVVCHRPE